MVDDREFKLINMGLSVMPKYFHANFHENATTVRIVITEDNQHCQIHGLAYTINITSHHIKISL